MSPPPVSMNSAFDIVGEVQAERTQKKERETWRREEGNPTHDTTVLPPLPGCEGPRFALQEPRRGRSRRRRPREEEELPPPEVASTDNSDVPAMQSMEERFGHVEEVHVRNALYRVGLQRFGLTPELPHEALYRPEHYGGKSRHPAVEELANKPVLDHLPSQYEALRVWGERSAPAAAEEMPPWDAAAPFPPPPPVPKPPREPPPDSRRSLAIAR